MNKITAAAILMAAFFVLPGCKKTGDNQNIDNNKQLNFDLMSAKSGSYWRYAPRDGSALWQREARGKDTTVFGRVYSYYERRNDGDIAFDPEFFGKNNEDYFTLVDLDGNKDNYLDYLFYRNNSMVGSKWNNTGEVKAPTIGKVAVLIESEVITTDGKMTIGTNNFSNVIHVKSNLQATALNISVGSVAIWFVKDIGVIKEEAEINIAGLYNIKHTDSLIEYKIVP